MTEKAWRNDAVAKVTGRAKYADDYKFHNMLHVVPVYTGAISAIIRGIHTETAKTMPGVVRVVTAEDVPGCPVFGQIQRDYREKRTVIAVISFDNREELTRDASGSEDSRITSEVESVLRSWAIDTMEGFLRRMTNGRYMLITDDQHIEEAKTKRFAVLDSVRAVKGENNMSATISIGIGRAGVTATESELHARQALEMALGRGGDQVAIYQLLHDS